jgi:hypothetical protein
MRKLSQALMLTAALALPAPGMAQMLDASGRPAGSERRITAGLTIPLGASSAPESKPRLELRSSSHRFDPALAERDRVVARLSVPRSEARFGVTLDDRPLLVVDGHAVPAGPHKLGLSTVAWVAIGVVSVAVIGGLILVDRIEDSSD